MNLPGASGTSDLRLCNRAVDTGLCQGGGRLRLDGQPRLERPRIRPPTVARVLAAAEEIGFYGVRTIEHGIRQVQTTHRLGVLLERKDRTFYRNLGEAITEMAANWQGGRIELVLEYLEDLTPEKVDAHIADLGTKCEVMAIVAPQHHFVSDAIDEVLARGVPVTSKAVSGPVSASTIRISRCWNPCRPTNPPLLRGNMSKSC